MKHDRDSLYLNTSIEVLRSINERMKRLAKKKGISRNRLINLAIAEYLNRYEQGWCRNERDTC